MSNVAFEFYTRKKIQELQNEIKKLREENHKLRILAYVNNKEKVLHDVSEQNEAYQIDIREMVPIEAGHFIMGALQIDVKADDDEKPRHKVL